MVDGGATLLFAPFAQGSIDLAQYDHIEVLRGSAGQYIGTGDSGGVISLQRKRPLDHDQLLAEMQAGSFNFFRSELDVTGPVAFDGKLRARVIGSYQDRDFFYDITHENKYSVYGVVEGDLTANTILRVGASYTRQSDPGVNQAGLPRYATGADIKFPRATCFCAPWATQRTHTPEVFGALEQKFSPKWLFRIEGTYKTPITDATTPFLVANNFLPDRANLLQGSTSVSNGILKELAASATLTGAFSLFGRDQRIVVGSDYTSIFYRTNADNYALPVQPDAFAFTYDSLGAAPDLTTTTGGQRQRSLSHTNGYYASLDLEPLKGLHIQGGGRYLTISQHSTNDLTLIFGTFVFPITVKQDYSDHYFNPSASASYAFTKNLSAYYSYNQTTSTQAYIVDVNLQPLKPSRGTTQEVGLRGQFADGKLNASVSGYSVVENNLGSFTSFSDVTNCCYTPAGRFTSKGIDAELTGQIVPGWQVQASYNYNENRSRFPASDSVQSPFITTQQPKHQGKVWTSLNVGTLTPTLRDLTLGGGVRVESRRSEYGLACQIADPTAPVPTCGSYSNVYISQPTYEVADLFAEYRLNKSFTIGVNVNNLTNTRYYSRVNLPAGQNYYGEPRAFLVRLAGRF